MVMVAVAVEGEDGVLGHDRAGGCGAGGVDPVNGSSVSIAFEPIYVARGDGGDGGSGGGVDGEIGVGRSW